MTHYVIGDLQGCFNPLMSLLKAIKFNPARDQITFCGDIVNRGGQSLDVLRWVYANQHCCDTVLGNHDLSLLSKYHVLAQRVPNAEFEAIYAAPEVNNLMDWLLKRPLYIELPNHYVVHAGIYPQWSCAQMKRQCEQAVTKMREKPEQFFTKMFGNQPRQWHKDLDQTRQMRFTINAMTRMRFVSAKGSLNFSEKKKKPRFKKLYPWFESQDFNAIKKHVIFGHWSALGYFYNRHVTCLDTGKVWGGKLTAMRLSDHHIFQV